MGLGGSRDIGEGSPPPSKGLANENVDTAAPSPVPAADEEAAPASPAPAPRGVMLESGGGEKVVAAALGIKGLGVATFVPLALLLLLLLLLTLGLMVEVGEVGLSPSMGFLVKRGESRGAVAGAAKGVGDPTWVTNVVEVCFCGGERKVGVLAVLGLPGLLLLRGFVSSLPLPPPPLGPLPKEVNGEGESGTPPSLSSGLVTMEKVVPKGAGDVVAAAASAAEEGAREDRGDLTL